MRVKQMLSAHPGQPGVVDNPLSACIELCYECSQACSACADACLGEPEMARLRRCISLDLDCADICAVTGRVLTRRTETEAGPKMDLLQACAAACRACAEECERHAGMMEHCRICAEACRNCETACNDMLSLAGRQSGLPGDEQYVAP